MARFAINRLRKPHGYNDPTGRHMPVDSVNDASQPFERSVIRGLSDRTAFNGAAIRIGEQYLLAYRARDGEKSIGLAWLDVDLRVVNGSVTDLHLVNNEDPRLLLLSSGEVVMSTNCWSNGKPNQIELRKIECKNGCVVREAGVLGEFDIVHNWPGYTRRQEKNWAPFEWEDSICFVYSVRPHRVLRFDKRSGTVSLFCVTDWSLPNWWRDEWGRDLRLSAPPVRLSDRSFLSTWHTCTPSGYWTGFYEFEAAPPFRVLRFCGFPFLTPGDATDRNQRNPARDRCIFISGMEVEERRDEVLLVGGDNDRKVAAFRTSLRRVRNGQRAIGSGASRILRFGAIETVVVNVNATPNIGDLASAPHRYFDLGNVATMDLSGGMLLQGRNVIVGGGGVLGSWYGPMIESILRSRPRRLILWGVGLNDSWSELPAWAAECDLFGVRDDGFSADWVPCASCCSSLFDVPIAPTHDVVAYYYHAIAPPSLHIDVPVMFNDVGSMSEAIAFLTSGRTVVTNSYHGAFWATLLGRRVIVTRPTKDRAVKFERMRHRPTILASDALTDQMIEETAVYPTALNECRAANRAFYAKVMQVLR